MQFVLTKDKLLKPLQQVCAILGGKPSIAVLNNILMQVKDLSLTMTCTDLEVELSVQTELLESENDGDFTIPARKLLDICKNLPDMSVITFSIAENRTTIKVDRSKFMLPVLPANEYPVLGDWDAYAEFSLPQTTLRRVIEATHFSMANQDARYFLNGMKFETEGNILRTVTTDGHRLAVCSLPFNQEFDACSIIIPRKAVNDMKALLEHSEQTVTVQIGKNNILLDLNKVVFTAKLIEGNFPDFRRVIPIDLDYVMEANWLALKQAFTRAAILTNDLFRGVRLNITENQLKISVQNPEQEEVEEIIDVVYVGEPLEIGFNVRYLLDVFDAMKCQRVRFRFTVAGSSCLMEDCDDSCVEYVIMPMRI